MNAPTSRSFFRRYHLLLAFTLAALVVFLLNATIVIAAPPTEPLVEHADTHIDPGLAEKWRAEADASNLEILGPGAPGGTISRVGHGLILRGDVEGPVSVVGGDLYIVGKVRGPVSVVGGTLTVLGETEGSVSVQGGDLRVAGHVADTYSLIGGELIRAKDARVDDDDNAPPAEAAPSATPAPNDLQRALAKVTMNWLANGKTTKVDMNINSADDLTDELGGSWASVVIGGIMLVCWLATSLLITTLFPRAVTRAADLLATQTAKVFAVGVAFWLVFAIALFVSAILSIALVGIPLMGILLLIGVAVRWFGLAVLFLSVGRLVCRKQYLANPEPYLPVFVGAALLAVLHMIPFLGLILWPLTFIPVAGSAALAFSESRRKDRSGPIDV